MTIERWSDGIDLVKLRDEPQFSEVMTSLEDRQKDAAQVVDTVLNLSAVTHVTSSNISQMLRTRQRLLQADRRLRLCGVSDTVWSTLMTTGLDKVFEVSPDVASALATVQLRT